MVVRWRKKGNTSECSYASKEVLQFKVGDIKGEVANERSEGGFGREWEVLTDDATTVGFRYDLRWLIERRCDNDLRRDDR